MTGASVIGVDLAKSVFQLHGATADGQVAFRKRLSREQFHDFLKAAPRCLIAIEACGASYYWGRIIRQMGHQVRIIPPGYVRPFVKRHKNDATDAEALSEATLRPNMRFTPVKSETQQARAMALKTRDLLVRQRSQLINALRGHLAEFGQVAGAGRNTVNHLIAHIARLEVGLPEAVVELAGIYAGQLAACTARISELDTHLKKTAAADPDIARLQTVPGIGKLSALTIKAFAPAIASFKHGRDFSAWLGLVPRQRSSGGHQKLGPASKMGQRDIRRLLIIGAMSRIRWAIAAEGTDDVWLERTLARKPRLLAAVALANRMARAAWAVLTTRQDYIPPEDRIAG